MNPSSMDVNLAVKAMFYMDAPTFEAQQDVMNAKPVTVRQLYTATRLTTLSMTVTCRHRNNTE